MTGDMVKADQALSIGLVDRVVPPESLMDEVRKMAEKILSKGPIAVRLAKAAINFGSETSLVEGIAFEIQKFSEIFGTEDKNEGTKAFLEKRAPDFKDK